MSFERTIPLSLYIHIPWCIKKCPYCDFNSHAQTGELPEAAYIDQLVRDLETQLHYVQNRPIRSIFIGGGTPSLFSPQAYKTLFHSIQTQLTFAPDCEITLEANPGTLVPNRFAGYFDAGINRVSLGVQSFQNEKLTALGRIHNNEQAKNAFKEARLGGFENINIDLMFGLPNQTLSDARFDLENAIALDPSHLSWYQLTLEPNTYFHRFPPTLPDDDARFDIQQAGQDYLAAHDFKQYEISAYAKNNQRSQHNMNYWQFGDYLGIGAGAHAKLTNLNDDNIIRRWNVKHPKQYLSATANNLFESKAISPDELPLEFMMNALRLRESITIHQFESSTGLPFSAIKNKVQEAVTNELMICDDTHFQVTEKGYLFLNDLLEMFV
jgi:putative oxygen-independent coproporphyrinogen III oxidase